MVISKTPCWGTKSMIKNVSYLPTLKDNNWSSYQSKNHHRCYRKLSYPSSHCRSKCVWQDHDEIWDLPLHKPCASLPQSSHFFHPLEASQRVSNEAKSCIKYYIYVYKFLLISNYYNHLVWIRWLLIPVLTKVLSSLEGLEWKVRGRGQLPVEPRAHILRPGRSEGTSG